MSRLAIVLALAAAILLAVAPAAAQCTKDLDCKGDRICEEGVCVDPPASQEPETDEASPEPEAEAGEAQPKPEAETTEATQEPEAEATETEPEPAPPPEPAPTPEPTPITPHESSVASGEGGPTPAPVPVPPPGPKPPMMPFQSGYFEASLFMSFHTWGGQTWEIASSPFDDPEFNTSTAILAGPRFAGYAVLGEIFHLGGYFAVRAGEVELEPGNDAARMMYFEPDADSDAITWGLGLAFKLGGRVAERVWIGGGADAGLHFFKFDDWNDTDDDTFFGLELFPRFVLDIILVDTGGFRLALPISVGAVVSPIAVAEPRDEAPQVDVRMWHVAPAATLGLAGGV